MEFGVFAWLFVEHLSWRYSQFVLFLRLIVMHVCVNSADCRMANSTLLINVLSESCRRNLSVNCPLWHCWCSCCMCAEISIFENRPREGGRDMLRHMYTVSPEAAAVICMEYSRPNKAPTSLMSSCRHETHSPPPDPDPRGAERCTARVCPLLSPLA